MTFEVIKISWKTIPIFVGAWCHMSVQSQMKSVYIHSGSFNAPIESMDQSTTNTNFNFKFFIACGLILYSYWSVDYIIPVKLEDVGNQNYELSSYFVHIEYLMYEKSISDKGNL